MLVQENRRPVLQSRLVSPLQRLAADGSFANSVLLGCGLGERLFNQFQAYWRQKRYPTGIKEINFAAKDCTYSLHVTRRKMEADEVSVRISFPFSFELSATVVPVELPPGRAGVNNGKLRLDPQELAVVKALVLTAR
jgi:hypothetical protein